MAHLFLLVAAVGLIAFVAITAFAPFKDKTLSTLFPKDASFTAENKVDVFDYSLLLSNFGQ